MVTLKKKKAVKWVSPSLHTRIIRQTVAFKVTFQTFKVKFYLKDRHMLWRMDQVYFIQKLQPSLSLTLAVLCNLVVIVLLRATSQRSTLPTDRKRSDLSMGMTLSSGKKQAAAWEAEFSILWILPWFKTNRTDVMLYNTVLHRQITAFFDIFKSISRIF